MTDELARARQRGFGHRVGFGRRPALLIVDFMRGFTAPERSLGAAMEAEIAEANRLLEAAHVIGAPVYLSTIAYADPGREAGVWAEKIAGLRDLVLGTPEVEQDPRLRLNGAEHILVKHFASCFFGTDLAARLRADDVDTLVIAGCTTSGCVRASAVDACQHGFRAIVAREATADRIQAAHAQSLEDIDLKYGDVLPVEEILAQLRNRAG
ncbi:isochorismatase family protein [Pseudoroseomonas wenyumeiae]|uniref:Isochorismatase family protein n=1 Tax=Teichococcus wenyumeiae TaxID=2478470 RepID=A0A3A9J879_9PROT|nr:isochorismatase family protein [Pseudoroseomonas wenyumeiae]RKK02662.1 isochorismatase family protein [Pseudoroseomonas wenyumeiae]RMI15596.1 isochorismatase family protein [Pseudoroseomonas wenyumeiae]